MRHIIAVLSAVIVSYAMGVSVADAYDWGPRHSWFKGNRVVSGEGKQVRKEGGSRSWIRATDRLRDGNQVYGYTDWHKLKEECKSVGASAEVVESSSTVCSVKTERVLHWDVKARADRAGESVADAKFKNWCDDDGKACADYGLKQVAGACAQMGWPVPDSCTPASVVYHRP